MRNAFVLGPVLAISLGLAHAVEPAPTDADQDIRRIGLQAPRDGDATRRAFHGADDLYAYVAGALPAAQAGHGAAQYHVYLALDECRSYLRLAAGEAEALHARLRSIRDDWSSEEEALLLDRTYRRCRAFAGGDLTPLLAAMGADAPGAESEYAAVWFERAVRTGYAPALADFALRPFEWDAGARRATLRSAAGSGDPDVFLRLFQHASAGESAQTMPASALVWLILACRAGADCSADAPWFRAAICDRANAPDTTACGTRTSAIEHYWSARAPGERLAAYRRAASAAAGGEALEALPWPQFVGTVWPDEAP